MRVRAIIAALIFIALTVIKYTLPDEVESIRDLFMPAVSEGVDYRAKAIDLGRAISGGGTVYAAGEAESDEPVIRETETGADLKSRPSADIAFSGIAELSLIELEGFIERFRLDTDLGSAEALAFSGPGEAEPPPLSPQEIKKEEFLEAQAIFSEYDLPDKVSYDLIPLPFETSRPVAESLAVSGFGFRTHPIFGDIRFHFGSDFSAYHGDNIYAFADGIVITAQDFDGYGLTVIIEHAEDFTTLYAHCSRLLVQHGERVSSGQLIALVGQTGRVTGPHLHFELMMGGIFLNPEFYL